MTTPDESFPVSLIVATRNRYDCIGERLPYWKSAGFDEVIIVDGTYDPKVSTKIRELCERHGARYLKAPRRFADSRSISRNLGAREARGAWILFQDDDDDAMISLDKDALRAAAEGKDWLTGPRGDIILWHRREAFLAFGGYPEDMVAAEDGIMSNRARGHGVGGPEGVWFHDVVTFQPAKGDPIGRARNAFLYGYTVLVLLLRTPQRNEVFIGDVRRISLMIRGSLRQVRNVVYLAAGIFGRILSPMHCFRILLRSGADSLRQERYSSWQGQRSQ